MILMEDILKVVNQRLFSNLEDLKVQRARWRENKKRVVFTNGCFDLLHLGHLAYLSQARSLGDILIVGLNSDSSVRKIKGTQRPVKAQDERSLHLAALSFVDAVIVFEEETPAELIAALEPDILVKGGDYRPDEVVGKDLVESLGGQVTILPFVSGYSTTNLIQKIQSL